MAVIGKKSAKSAASGEPTATVEDYLQIIYYMNRDGRPVFGVRLAEKLGVSAPTVTATLQRMRRDGIVSLDSRKEVHLSERGWALAESIVRRHALAEHLLVDLLGLRWAEAHLEAHRVEHAISPLPTARWSTSTIGVTWAAVHTMNISSAVYISLRATWRSTVSMPSSSRANWITVLRVIPTRMLSDSAGVTSLPPTTRKRFSPDPSHTVPWLVSMIASSNPASAASVRASALLM